MACDGQIQAWPNTVFFSLLNWKADPKDDFMLSDGAMLLSLLRAVSLLRVSHKVLNNYLFICAYFGNMQCSAHDAIRWEMQT